MKMQSKARWMRSFLHAIVLTPLLLPLGAPTGEAATKPLVEWQPFACGLDAVVAFVSFQGVSLSVSEHGLQDGTPSAGTLVTIKPAVQVSSLNFAVRGYTNLQIVLTGDKGTAKAVVNNGSMHRFVSWKLTPKNFAGNAGNVSSIKISVQNNSNFGSAPSYIQNLQVNGSYANAILKSLGWI